MGGPILNAFFGWPGGGNLWNVEPMKGPGKIMNLSLYAVLLVSISCGFTIALAVLCVPPLIENPDLIGAVTAGFVNPYASGYALDAICCWCVLAVWVIHEARTRRIRHGWLALLLGVVPGVAVGFAVYLLLRLKQVSPLSGPGSVDVVAAPQGSRAQVHR